MKKIEKMHGKGMVVHEPIYSPSNQEAETGRLPHVCGQCGLQNRTKINKHTHTPSYSLEN